MLIDWFTVAAQAVNFLILLWLLKRFLYGPILAAMKKRREALADEIAQARQSHKLADRRAEELAGRHAKLDRQAEEMLLQARDDALKYREEWLAEARAEVDNRSAAWAEELSRERAALSERLKVRMAEEAVRLSQKVLTDLAGEDLESLAVEGFISRLTMPKAESSVGGVAIVRTGFPMSESLAEQLESAVREHFPACNGVEASEDKTLGFGIVMVVGDTKREWSLASYLDEVEEAVFAELAGAKVAT